MTASALPPPRQPDNDLAAFLPGAPPFSSGATTPVTSTALCNPTSTLLHLKLLGDENQKLSVKGRNPITGQLKLKSRSARVQSLNWLLELSSATDK